MAFTDVCIPAGEQPIWALEVIVHHGGIPGDYQVILVDISDALPIESIDRSR
jgi:hypothetical protein